MKNLRKNYFIKPGFQAKLTVIILLIVVIVANIVGGVIYGLLSGSALTDQLAKAFEVENSRDLLLPVILFAELVAIIIVTFIGIFVSHTMAGPVYRFERVLEDLADGELDSHFHLRTSDEFQEMAASLNTFIASLNSRISEIKVYASTISNILKDVNSPKSMNAGDIEDIKESISKLSNVINYFKMIETPGEEEEQAAAAYSPATVIDESSLAVAPKAEKAETDEEPKLSNEDLIKEKKPKPAQKAEDNKNRENQGKKKQQKRG